jgi:hypothetical protein
MAAAQVGVRKKLIVRSGPLSPVEYRVDFARLTLWSAAARRLDAIAARLDATASWRRAMTCPGCARGCVNSN